MSSKYDEFEERAAQARERADAIEATKERKQRERLEKQRAAELKKKRQLQEKLVAPLLMVATIIISALLMVFSQ